MERSRKLSAPGALALAIATTLPAQPAVAEASPSLSFYGTSGLIDMPTAQSQPDGTLSFTSSYFGPTLRNTLSFQITPRLSGSFRYSWIRNFDLGGTQDRYDRSFDLSYRFVDEGDFRPAVAVGLQDFGGTGTLGAEYLVASKTVKPGLVVSGGIGWGRFGSYRGFTNPLAIFGNKFRHRPSGVGGITNVGRVEFGRWFRGDAAFFAGLAWQINDRLSFAAEYSSDAYTQEAARGLVRHRSPFNFGARYHFDNGLELGAYYLYGSEVGVLLSYAINPAHPKFPGGIEEAPPPLRPRNTLAAASWGGATTQDPPRLEDRLRTALERQGLKLVSLSRDGDEVTVHLVNQRYGAAAQAIGRASRVLANTMPPSVEIFVVVPEVNGLPISAVTLRRTDLEELENALDGSWQSYVRADINDAGSQRRGRSDAQAYPDFSYRVGGYFSPALFDPDNPVRADLGVQLAGAYAPVPGLVFAGALRQPVIGNLDSVTRRSNSVLPHVRSDAALYDIESDLELSYLTAEYFFRPGKNLFGRVTGGYLERMYGGVSAELLWKPVTGPLALGAEINYVRQRDFDQGFGFRNYDVVTGHVSAYYDFGNGYLGEVDVGRYLAKDWGATVSFDREFPNGVRVGAFFTLTNVPFDRFGEGSFDKGIRIHVPLSWLSGQPSQRGFGTVIRPLTRDGGARLDVRNRLYEMTRDYSDPRLRARWGRFWR